MSGLTNDRRPRGRGRGKERKDTHNQQQQPSQILSTDEKIAENATQVAVPEEADAINDEADEIPTCFICAEPIVYYSLAQCDHRTCHVCAVRLRALYKKTDCTFCKMDQPIVVFTRDADKPFAELDVDNMPFHDKKLRIAFETQDMMDDTLVLLRFNCPDKTCDYIATGWGDLKIHVRGAHGKILCDMCTRNKKVFAHEHTMYTPSQFPIHLPSAYRHGPKPSEKDRAQMEGDVHPMCQFCRECFFNDDEIFKHMRERHEECFVCKRGGNPYQYYRSYEQLENHFFEAHYACKNEECLAQKFVVFDSLMDLRAHTVDAHGAQMTARDKRDALRLQSDFEFESRPSAAGPQSRGGRGGRIRRDDFGARLTTPAQSLASSSATPVPAVQHGLRPSAPPILAPDSHDADADDEPYVAQLKTLIPNAPGAVKALAAAVRSFRSGESGPKDIISTFFNVFDRETELTARAISAVVEALSDEDRRSALLAAWNGFKIEQQRQFPDLVPTASGSEYAGIAAGRLLNVKQQASARSARQPASRVWDRVAQAASVGTSRVPPRQAERFPALHSSFSRPPASSSTPRPNPNARATPWASSHALASPAPTPPPAPPPHSVNRVNASKPTPVKLSSTAFPTLPPSSGPQRVPVTGNVSLRNIVGDNVPAVNAWKKGGRPNSGAANPASETPPPVEPLSSEGKGKKKRGKEKQTLFTLGTFPT